MITKFSSITIDSSGQRVGNADAAAWANAFERVLSEDHPFKSNNPGSITKYAVHLSNTETDREKLHYSIKKFCQAKTASTRAYWLKQSGDLLGGTNDQELEAAIFTLSSHFIMDKAPKLFDMNYFVGFRILDANEDNTKVVGIYGFKIGKSWVYIPVFFNKGKINGFELCYIQTKDQFVPLKEGWIDWIIKNSGDESFGKSNEGDLRSLGVRYPDMRQLTQPPILGKVASFEPWVQQGLLGIMKHANFTADMTKSAADLEKIASQDAKVYTRLAIACNKYPLFKVAMDSFYGKDFLQRTLDSLIRTHRKVAAYKRTITPVAQPLKHSAVRIITEDDTAAFPYLTEKQAAELIENGNLVVDERMDDEVATVEDEIKFTSPDKTGVYDVFFADGTFRECLVILDPIFIKKFPSRELCVVVDWKRKQYVYAKAMAVLCVAGSYKDDWFNRLPADQFRSATSMRSSDAKRCRNRIIVTEDGIGTCPFTADNHDGVWQMQTYDSGTDNRDRTYDIDEGVGHIISHYQALLNKDTSAKSNLDGTKNTGIVRWIICSSTMAGRKLVIRNDKLILPKVFKYIDADYEYDQQSRTGTSLALATENDVLQLLYKDRKKLRAAKTASTYVLDGKAFDKSGAFKTLVEAYSFRSKIANEILAAAELTGGHTISIPYVVPRYKVAELPIDPIFGQGGMLSGMPDNTMSPIFPEQLMGNDGYSGLPIQEGVSDAQRLGYEDQPIPPEFTQEIPPPDPMAMQQAADAAQTGQKNLFDTSVLVGLLNTNRRDEAISDYTKIFRTALDRICRLYFHFLADRDSFVERYNEENIDKFEETLLDVMSSLGDLLLFILQKDDRPELGDILDQIGVGD